MSRPMTYEIHSSPAAQWLQGLLAKGAPSQVGSRSSAGATELPRDTSRISAQAFQLNQAAGTSLTAQARGTQSLGTHKKIDPAFVSHATQPTVSPLEQRRRMNTNSVNAGDSTITSVHGEHERASKMSHDCRVAYSHAEATSPSVSSRERPISVFA